jgi:hypothetical protein
VHQVFLSSASFESLKASSLTFSCIQIRTTYTSHLCTYSHPPPTLLTHPPTHPLTPTPCQVDLCHRGQGGLTAARLPALTRRLAEAHLAAGAGEEAEAALKELLGEAGGSSSGETHPRNSLEGRGGGGCSVCMLVCRCRRQL